jgi:hypothetical protein
MVTIKPRLQHNSYNKTMVTTTLWFKKSRLQLSHGYNNIMFTIKPWLLQRYVYNKVLETTTLLLQWSHGYNKAMVKIKPRLKQCHIFLSRQWILVFKKGAINARVYKRLVHRRLSSISAWNLFVVLFLLMALQLTPSALKRVQVLKTIPKFSLSHCHFIVILQMYGS